MAIVAFNVDLRGYSWEFCQMAYIQVMRWIWEQDPEATVIQDDTSSTAQYRVKMNDDTAMMCKLGITDIYNVKVINEQADA